jgi:hypothetical protein
VLVEDRRAVGMRMFVELLELLEVRAFTSRSSGLPSVCAGDGRRPPKGRRHLRHTALPMAFLCVDGCSRLTGSLRFEKIVMLDDGVDRVSKTKTGRMVFAISQDAAAGRPSRMADNVLDLLGLSFLTPLL